MHKKSFLLETLAREGDYKYGLFKIDMDLGIYRNHGTVM